MQDFAAAAVDMRELQFNQKSVSVTACTLQTFTSEYVPAVTNVLCFELEFACAGNRCVKAN